MPRLMREAGSNLEYFPPRDIAAGQTVGAIRREHGHSMQLTVDGQHLGAFVGGEPVSDDYVLQENDVLYFKRISGKRG